MNSEEEEDSRCSVEADSNVKCVSQIIHGVFVQPHYQHAVVNLRYCG